MHIHIDIFNQYECAFNLSMKCLEITFSTFLRLSASWFATLFKKSGLCNLPRTRATTPSVRCLAHAGRRLHSITRRRYNKASLLARTYNQGHIPGCCSRFKCNVCESKLHMLPWQVRMDLTINRTWTYSKCDVFLENKAWRKIKIKKRT